MAKEYIERESLLKDGIPCSCGHVTDEGIVMIPLRDVRKFIKSVPAADVVEVVRCKDCRYWVAEKKLCININGLCTARDNSQDNFCSHGKRRVI